jgi:hypothetical protein
MAPITSLFLLAASVAAIPTFDKTKRDALPDYALQFAPYSYLYSGEGFWPSDVATHLQHVTPEVNFAAVGPNQTLETLDGLASDVYLTSDDNPLSNPAWLVSTYGKPTSTGYSAAPATIIVVDKSTYLSPSVDVFYFYFYSYNQGLEYVSHIPVQKSHCFLS